MKILLKFIRFMIFQISSVSLMLFLISPVLKKHAASDLKAFATTEDGSPDWFNLSQPMLAPTKAVIEWMIK